MLVLGLSLVAFAGIYSFAGFVTEGGRGSGVGDCQPSDVFCAPRLQGPRTVAGPEPALGRGAAIVVRPPALRPLKPHHESQPGRDAVGYGNPLRGR